LARLGIHEGNGGGSDDGGCWMVVVDGMEVMGQCLATDGCQTLKLLIKDKTSKARRLDQDPNRDHP